MHKKNIVRFISLFVLFSILNFLFDYLFRPSNIDLLRNISAAFGVSFGVIFLSNIFKNKKENL